MLHMDLAFMYIIHNSSRFLFVYDDEVVFMIFRNNF